MLFLFQLLFIIFSFFAIASVLKRKKSGELGPKGALFWMLFWLAADIAVLWPNGTTIAANHLGIGRGTDFVLYIALAAIFYILFKLHIKIEIIGRDLTRVVRKDALDKPGKI